MELAPALPCTKSREELARRAATDSHQQQAGERDRARSGCHRCATARLRQAAPTQQRPPKGVLHEGNQISHNGSCLSAAQGPGPSCRRIAMPPYWRGYKPRTFYKKRTNLPAPGACMSGRSRRPENSDLTTTWMQGKSGGREVTTERRALPSRAPPAGHRSHRRATARASSPTPERGAWGRSRAVARCASARGRRRCPGTHS